MTMMSNSHGSDVVCTYILTTTYLASHWNSSELLHLRLVPRAGSMSWFPVLPESTTRLWPCWFWLSKLHSPYNIRECVNTAQWSLLIISSNTGWVTSALPSIPAMPCPSSSSWVWVWWLSSVHNLIKVSNFYLMAILITTNATFVCYEMSNNFLF